MDSLLMIDYEIITPTIDDGYIIDNYQYDAVVTADGLLLLLIILISIIII